jgi:hypothetical protein
LNENKNTLSTLYEFDDVDQALKLFASKQAAGNVILTGKDNKILKRNRRQAQQIEILKSNSNYTDWYQAAGSNCMILFESIYIQDYMDNKILKIHLEITEPDGIILDCSNSTAMLV